MIRTKKIKKNSVLRTKLSGFVAHSSEVFSRSSDTTLIIWVAVISAKNHKRQRRKRQSVTAKREKSQTPKVLTAILTLLAAVTRGFPTSPPPVGL